MSEEQLPKGTEYGDTCEECDTEVAEGQHICKDCKFALGIFYFT